MDFPRESAEMLALARLQAVQARKLRSNRHKGGWHGLSNERLLSLLIDEVKELQIAIHNATAGFETSDRILANNILEEAADVANFCAFIVDGVMTSNPQLMEESGDARWARRIKLLEDRIDRSVDILRGTGHVPPVDPT
jgi:hypothetical protein